MASGPVGIQALKADRVSGFRAYGARFGLKTVQLVI